MAIAAAPDPDPVPEPEPSPATLTRDELVAEIERKILTEPGFEAKVLAEIYATTYEWRLMLDALQTSKVGRGIFGRMMRGAAGAGE